MELQGTIKLIDTTKTYGSNGFQKREMVITTMEQYPQPVKVEFVQDKCSILDSYQVGQDVKISINIKGREWVNPQGQTQYFVSVQGWKIESLQPAASADNSAPPMPPTPPMDSFEPAKDFDEDAHDDLPF
ncbi:MAG: DUF3127 domain-containing protein [Flavobacteriaceae bacterium]|nr:DUF3127 domain-containing protein [Flavobacteriaceae bacterium]